jgi:sensor histidine kinase YesM
MLAALLAQSPTLGWAGSVTLALPLACVYAFVCLGAWYVCRAVPLRGAGPVRLAGTIGLAALVSSGAWIWAGRAWAAALGAAGLIQGAPFTGASRQFFVVGVLLFLLAVAVHYLLLAFEQSRLAERRGLELTVFARDAELKALRAQIDPHFLFNSLNSISALTTADPAASRRMCLQLADFLRDSLASGARDRIPLAQELGLARHFLGIEQVRFGPRLQVAITANDGVETLQVPPLILQPLVENAVTHGVSRLIEGGTVAVTARRTERSLVLTVENPCDPDRPGRRGAGVGLNNVKRRIETLYGADARLDVEERPSGFRVELTLPAE